MNQPEYILHHLTDHLLSHLTNCLLKIHNSQGLLGAHKVLCLVLCISHGILKILDLGLITHSSQMRKQRLGEVEQHVQGHKLANDWQPPRPFPHLSSGEQQEGPQGSMPGLVA